MLRLAKLLTLVWAALALARPAMAKGEYCSAYKSGDEIVLVLIDLTSRPEGVFQRSLEQAATWLVANVEPGQKVVIETIVDDSLKRDRLFEECKPGRKQGVFDRPLNSSRLEHDNESFAPMLNDAMNNGWKMAKYGWSKNNAIKKSVIIGTIGAASMNLPKKSVRSLILVSDLLEKDILMLPPEKPMGNFEVDEALLKIRSSSGFGNFEDAHVQIYGFGFSDFDYDNATKMRKPLPLETRKNLEQFWRRYFGHAKAKDVFIQQ
ncbi:MAG: hypothetical protein HQL44_08650 [Alphaproteobacteria bacterium]|nr:hypothetical protein [Alphaproteobacteria bacterium]